MGFSSHTLHSTVETTLNCAAWELFAYKEVSLGNILHAISSPCQSYALSSSLLPKVALSPLDFLPLHHLEVLVFLLV